MRIRMKVKNLSLEIEETKTGKQDEKPIPGKFFAIHNVPQLRREVKRGDYSGTGNTYLHAR